MKFTIPVSVIPYKGTSLSHISSELTQFDDVMLYNNVVFALVSNDEKMINIYFNLANKYRERFYFFDYRLE